MRVQCKIEGRKKKQKSTPIRDSMVPDHSLPFLLLQRLAFFNTLSLFSHPFPHQTNLSQQSHVSAEAAAARTQAFVDELRSMPVAIQTATANEQHYEVPTPYFLAVLGPKLKYSSCVYPKGDKSTLEEAEVAMLELACERAELEDGQDILELG